MHTLQPRRVASLWRGGPFVCLVYLEGPPPESIESLVSQHYAPRT